MNTKIMRRNALFCFRKCSSALVILIILAASLHLSLFSGAVSASENKLERIALSGEDSRILRLTDSEIKRLGNDWEPSGKKFNQTVANIEQWFKGSRLKLIQEYSSIDDLKFGLNLYSIIWRTVKIERAPDDEIYRVNPAVPSASLFMTAEPAVKVIYGPISTKIVQINLRYSIRQDDYAAWGTDREYRLFFMEGLQYSLSLVAREDIQNVTTWLTGFCNQTENTAEFGQIGKFKKCDVFICSRYQTIGSVAVLGQYAMKRLQKEIIIVPKNNLFLVENFDWLDFISPDGSTYGYKHFLSESLWPRFYSTTNTPKVNLSMFAPAEMQAITNNLPTNSIVSEPQHTNNLDEKVISFLIKYADEGVEQSQYKLGIRYLEGNGVSLNKEKGVFYLKKAADQGNNEAIEMLRKLGIRR